MAWLEKNVGGQFCLIAMKQVEGSDMRVAAILLLILLLDSCNGALSQKHDFPVNANDFTSIAHRAFELIDPNGAISTIVVPPGLDPLARDALGKMRTLVSADHVPQSAQVKLPAGYFAVTTFSVSLEDGVATLEGQLGPVSRSITAANMPDCGKIYTVDFYLQGGDWVSHAFKMGTCAESRHWIPIDQGPQHP